ncbi:hypothetical protein FE374_18280 [Georgenia yuyongxinii]|uniref:Uncharacterized protein n=1 Tax=Georgenia yuyongxinii TaxID=2589797 RepID=A0A5B8C869_9MICO|nr:DUF3696 domain-containing protein [Georgenia yuyongxinii]QDC26297.1 hypothetical protein FE374_18280 [Georgenia yuyongxinii]
MPDPHDPEQEQEQEQAVGSRLGPDWVGLDRRRMTIRQDDYVRRMRDAAMREAEELKRAEEAFRRFDADLSDEESSAHRGVAKDARPDDSDDPATPQKRRRPKLLVTRFHAENLKSLAGRHEVPLAPLTLVYGPNSAGKSTVLNGLRLFMHAVDAGRFDALGLWRRAFPDVRPESVITWERQGEDVPFSQTRTLKLGVDYRISGSDSVATAELGFQSSDVGPWQSSAMGANLQELTHKEFFLNYEAADRVDSSSYGNVEPKWEVREWTGAEAAGADPRDVDHDLFGHANAELKRALFRLAGQLTHFGPHRGAPEGKYTPVGLDDIAGPDTWGVAGAPSRRIAGFEVQELLNQALEQLEIDHRFEPVFRAEGGTVSISDWQLVDSRSGAPVSLAEVGYGVSQLLPIIDVCLRATQRIICIEEPELHLHPRLQAKLGNLLALSVLRRGNQLIVETHSESLLLRVRRLVRQGKLHHDDVAVLYVDNIDGEGAHVRRLRLGEQGELLDPWPTGFFDDTLEDVLGGWG